MPQYVYPGDLIANTLAQASDVNSRVTGLAAAVNNVDGTQLLAGVVALTHLTPTLAAMVVQSGALPASPAAYQPWVDTADKRFKVYNGATWDKYAAETLAQTWAEQQTFSLPIAAPVNQNLVPNPTGAEGLAYWTQTNGPPNQWAAAVSFATAAGPTMFQSGSGSLAASTHMTLTSVRIPTGGSTPLVLSGSYRVPTGAGADIVYAVLCQPYNASGTALGSPFGLPTATVDGANHTFQGALATPAGTSYVTVYLDIANGSSTTAETFENMSVWNLKLEANATVASVFTDDQSNPDTLMGVAGGRMQIRTPLHHGYSALDFSQTAWTNLNTAYPMLGTFTFHADEWAKNGFCLDATIANNTAGDVTNVGIWDITAGALVAGSSASATGTAATRVRCPFVSLIDGHVYTVAGYVSAGTGELLNADFLQLL